MRVITLDESGFADACRCLQHEVEANGFSPDVVVGIASGGDFVARLMMDGVPHLSVCCRRPSTSHKGGVARAVVRMLPRCLQDALRIAEARVLSLRSGRRGDVSAPVVPDAGFEPGRVLVVDDAVDSGSTLAAVLGAVKARWPRADVRSAVITVTTSAPAAMPEYKLYNNLTLIRFPWSIDA